MELHFMIAIGENSIPGMIQKDFHSSDGGKESWNHPDQDPLPAPFVIILEIEQDGRNLFRSGSWQDLICPNSWSTQNRIANSFLVNMFF